jgi:hypothetical protein
MINIDFKRQPRISNRHGRRLGEKQGKHVSLPRSGSHAICLFLVGWKKAHQLGTSLPPKQTLPLVQ